MKKPQSRLRSGYDRDYDRAAIRLPSGAGKVGHGQDSVFSLRFERRAAEFRLRMELQQARLDAPVCPATIKCKEGPILCPHGAFVE